MDWYYIVIILLSILFLGGIYIIFNLLRKVEKAEDIVAGYLDYLDKLSKVIEASDVHLKKLDDKGAFKSDDEIGFIFEQIVKIQEILNEFKLK